MTPKLSYSEKLKRFRKGKQEEYARVILSDPQRVPLYQALRYPGVIIIMGDIRSGKTGLAHEIARILHQKKRLPAVVHMPQAPDNIRKKIQKSLEFL